MGKGNKYNGKQIFATMLIIVLLGISGCKNNENKNEGREEEPVQTEQTVIPTDAAQVNAEDVKNFEDLVQETDNIEDLYDYIDANAEGATVEDWEEWMNGLLDFGSENADYNRFHKYRKNMSKEMSSFVELMSAEQKRPSVNEEGIQLTLGEILDRCIAFEKHMKSYRNGNTYTTIYPKYCQLLNAAITGAYDGIDKKTNEYLEEDGKHIMETAINEYKRIRKENPDSKTADILENYLETLQKNHKIMNQEVEDFYQNLYIEIDDEFQKNNVTGDIGYGKRIFIHLKECREEQIS